jgi:stage III sporulation protein AE
VKAEENITPETDVTTEIYESIPLDDVEEALNELKEDDFDFSIQEYVSDVLNGDGELSLSGIEEYIRTYLINQFQANKNTYIKLILYAVLSGLFLNFSTSVSEKQMSETGFYVIYFLTVMIMVTGFVSAYSVTQSVLSNVVDFMNVLVPSFSVALTWSSGSAASMAFYQAALMAIGVVEKILFRFFVPGVEIYFFLSLLNPLSGWRFTKLTSLIRGLIRSGTKIILTFLIGHQGIQGLIMPAIDGVKRSTLFQTASSIPGIGNMFGSVTDTVIGTGVLIKSAIGVGGVVAICLICAAPVLKLGIFAVEYRGLAALTQPVTDQRIVSAFQSTADSGKLLLYLVGMVAVMFLVSLSIVIAATNRIVS